MPVDVEDAAEDVPHAGAIDDPYLDVASSSMVAKSLKPGPPAAKRPKKEKTAAQKAFQPVFKTGTAAKTEK